MNYLTEEPSEQVRTRSGDDVQRCIHCHTPLSISYGWGKGFDPPRLRVIIQCHTCEFGYTKIYTRMDLADDLQRSPRQAIEDYAVKLTTEIFQVTRRHCAEAQP